jgi:hypothetical protein
MVKDLLKNALLDMIFPSLLQMLPSFSLQALLHSGFMSVDLRRLSLEEQLLSKSISPTV